MEVEYCTPNSNLSLNGINNLGGYGGSGWVISRSQEGKRQDMARGLAALLAGLRSQAQGPLNFAG